MTNKCVSALCCPACILLRNIDTFAKYAKVKMAHEEFTELRAVPCKLISGEFFFMRKSIISEPDRAEEQNGGSQGQVTLQSDCNPEGNVRTADTNTGQH